MLLLLRLLTRLCTHTTHTFTENAEAIAPRLTWNPENVSHGGTRVSGPLPPPPPLLGGLTRFPALVLSGRGG